jgi:hypothetical protein
MKTQRQMLSQQLGWILRTLPVLGSFSFLFSLMNRGIGQLTGCLAHSPKCREVRS